MKYLPHLSWERRRPRHHSTNQFPPLATLSNCQPPFEVLLVGTYSDDVIQVFFPQSVFSIRCFPFSLTGTQLHILDEEWNEIFLLRWWFFVVEKEEVNKLVSGTVNDMDWSWTGRGYLVTLYPFVKSSSCIERLYSCILVDVPMIGKWSKK